ncbi:MAG TPA: porin [Candidatus Brocadiaceae bacterium]|nr:porin [Candidatus Brocadiaceae bacterium]
MILIKLRYGLPLFMLFYAAPFVSKAQNAIAQDAVQGREAFQSEVDDLKRQLNQMEEAFLAQQKMMKEMEALALNQQAQIEELRNRIETVSAKPAAMAKEEVQDEVKQEVGSYLASDEARERLGLSLPGQYEPVNGYYLPDKEKATIGFQTKDGNYSFNLGFRFQSRFTYRDNSEDHGETDKTDIDVRRARLCFGGNVYSKDINYYVELDGDSFEVNTRDYYVWWSPLDGFNVKTGYFKVPANRQWNSSGFKLLLQDRSIACDAFKQDRDYGLDVFGRPFDGHAEYHAAIFRGAGQNPAKTLGKDENIDNELLTIFKGSIRPVSTITSAATVQRYRRT